MLHNSFTAVYRKLVCDFPSAPLPNGPLMYVVHILFDLETFSARVKKTLRGSVIYQMEHSATIPEL